MNLKIILPLDRPGCITLEIGFKRSDSGSELEGLVRDRSAPCHQSEAPGDASSIEANRRRPTVTPALDRQPSSDQISTTSQHIAQTSCHSPTCSVPPSAPCPLSAPDEHASPAARKSPPPNTQYSESFETQQSEISPSNLDVIQSFVRMFDESPEPPQSPLDSSAIPSPAPRCPSSPPSHQPLESQQPLASPLLGHAPVSAAHYQSDSGSETEPELDPIYDAYCLGYSDGHRNAGGGGEGGSRACSTHASDPATSSPEDDPTLVEDDDNEYPRTYVPIPSTNAGCRLTPRTRKRITVDLPQSPVTRAAVKWFKTTHNALVIAREAAKRPRA